ncbi:MAG: DUF4345 family protein [Bacteroidetes bacterium]|nr:DUF4345 family protein [Bacteroidota bacterium]MBS1630891.1 DUF4345 family protein [Bacteroidota bacterium]
MKRIAQAAFWGYIALVCVAGLWGAFLNPWFDFRWLFHMEVSQRPDFERINMLSQYRFLRALELGYGMFCVFHSRDIFSKKKINILFLCAMGGGITARLLSLVLDGRSSNWGLAFLSYEFIAWWLIFFFARRNIYS